MFSAAAQPSQQFPADVFLDPSSADPLALGKPLLLCFYPVANALVPGNAPLL